MIKQSFKKIGWIVLIVPSMILRSIPKNWLCFSILERKKALNSLTFLMFITLLFSPMCVSGRWIFNPYSRQRVFVKCGKCPACQQEKACARANRIRNNAVAGGEIPLFLTLTYTNDYIPYILKSELKSPNYDINVYRACRGRFVYSRIDGLRFKKYEGIEIIDKVFVPTENRFDNSIINLHHLVGADKDRVGVCLVSDIQKFFKRLKQILFRNYGITYTSNYFYCSEFGEHTYRPHFHVLLYVPSCYETEFREAIVKAWPYADKCRTAKYIEVAKNAASYVSSYVNCHIDVDSVLSLNKFKSKHNYSRGFGVHLECFQLASILQKIESGNLYYYRQQTFDGVSSVVPVPVPQYVISRYFPKFKGYSWLSQSQLYAILVCPSSVGYVLNDRKVRAKVHGIEFSFKTRNIIENYAYSYSPQESYAIYVRLENAYRYFNRKTGLGRIDFAYYYLRAHSLLFAVRERYLHCPPHEVVYDYEDFYDNNLDVINGYCKAPTLNLARLTSDPNNRQDLKLIHDNFIQLFDRMDKQRKVTNYVMSKNGHFV